MILDGHKILNKGLTSYGNNGGYAFRLYPGNVLGLDLNQGGNSGSYQVLLKTSEPVNDGEWHNVVMTRVGGTQQTYYDGVGITTTGGTYTDSTNYSGVDGWFIGKGGGTAFNGDLANITIRKGKGLSSDEVQQNFNALKSRFGV